MKFQCKYSGSVYEFTQQHDIDGMLTHPDYTVFEEAVKPVEEAPKPAVKRGRPAKKDEEADE